MQPPPYLNQYITQDGHRNEQPQAPPPNPAPPLYYAPRGSHTSGGMMGLPSTVGLKGKPPAPPPMGPPPARPLQPPSGPLPPPAAPQHQYGPPPQQFAGFGVAGGTNMIGPMGPPPQPGHGPRHDSHLMPPPPPRFNQGGALCTL